MSKKIRVPFVVGAVAVAIALFAGAANAAPNGNAWGWFKPKPPTNKFWPINPGPRVPEIDPNAARSAVALLAGGMMVLAERRRRR